MMFDRTFEYLAILSKGLPITISLSITTIIMALVMAIILLLLLTSNNQVLHSVIKSYIVVFTGTPLLVQLFLIYYGPAQFSDFLQQWPIVWHSISSPWFCAFIALTLNSTAYTTQLFYGSFKAVPQTLWIACAALGMNKQQTLQVIIPYALKRALSSYSNEIIFVVKGTALGSTITLMDIMGYNQLLNGEYYDFYIFILTGTLYLLMNSFLNMLLLVFEKRALRFERQE